MGDDLVLPNTDTGGGSGKAKSFLVNGGIVGEQEQVI